MLSLANDRFFGFFRLFGTGTGHIFYKSRLSGLAARLQGFTCF